VSKVILENTEEILEPEHQMEQKSLCLLAGKISEFYFLFVV
jgi:hypothetical protein